MSARILIVDDDRSFRLSTAELLRQDGHTVNVAAGGTEAVLALERDRYDLMLLDMRMPGIDGLSLIEVLRVRGERIPILMISGYGTVDSAVRSLHIGADDFLTKPVDPDRLSACVREILARRPMGDPPAVGGLVGVSRAIREVHDAIRRVAASSTTVLVTGETGTGKEIVARAIHDLSPRNTGPFVPINCASLAESLLESELFGHVRGAFTGAVGDRKGLFAAAHGGTLLLDEVGDMSLRLQQRLLRVLQESEVTPVGSARPQTVDVRIIAATHRDLTAEVAAGRFREDLYYRLKVFCIDVPPLRDRPDDIPLLVQSALRRIAQRSTRPVPESCAPLAMRLLLAHSWPGNVRELISCLESAAVQSDGQRIEAQHLPAAIRRPASSTPSDGVRAVQEQAVARGNPGDEREAIVAALAAAAGSRVRAAELMGMSRTTLWRRMREFGLAGEREEDVESSEGA